MTDSDDLQKNAPAAAVTVAAALLFCSADPALRQAARQHDLPLFEPRDAADWQAMAADVAGLAAEFNWPVLVFLPWDDVANAPLSDLPGRLASFSRTPRQAAAQWAAWWNLTESWAGNVLERGSGTPAARQCGVVACGAAYAAVRQRHPERAVLRLALSWPWPLRKLRGLSEMCGRVELALADDGTGFAPQLLREMAAEGVTVGHWHDNPASPETP